LYICNVIIKHFKQMETTAILTTGLSDNCKYVMYVAYLLLEDKEMGFYKLMYRGNLSQDYKTAQTKIKERLPNYNVIEWDSGLLEKRRQKATFPFGKYRGKTVEWVYDNDYKYLSYISRNYNFKKTTSFTELLKEYGKQAVEQEINENRKTQQDFLPIETKSNIKKLTVIKIANYGFDFYGNKKIRTTLIDTDNNKYVYTGRNLNTDINTIIERKFRIKDHNEYLGFRYNVLALR